MKQIEAVTLLPDSTIKKALETIDRGAMKLAVVTDKTGRLLGTISDGDIRRAILKGKSLESSIEDVYNPHPVTVGINESNISIINLCAAKSIQQIPVVDEQGRVVRIAVLDEMLRPKHYPNKVVLMVGGLGTRLRPLTEQTPKPMLKVGGKPILQTIVERFAVYGFADIVMCINYKGDMIREFFGDGKAFGVNITYVQEEERMGTAGALTLLPEFPKEPFFVMNGDLLTSVNFENMLLYHIHRQAKATMCVREFDFQVPFGVVQIKGDEIDSIEEKPIHKFFVNAGIYILDPECILKIPKNQPYDMPQLFEKLLEHGEKAVSFPIHEYWLDIGRPDQYHQANEEYKKVFDG